MIIKINFVFISVPPISVSLEAPGAWVSGGQEVEFRCRVEGASPQPVVQWWLAGRQINQHHAMVSIIFEDL